MVCKSWEYVRGDVQPKTELNKSNLVYNKGSKEADLLTSNKRQNKPLPKGYYKKQLAKLEDELYEAEQNKDQEDMKYISNKINFILSRGEF